MWSHAIEMLTDNDYTYLDMGKFDPTKTRTQPTRKQFNPKAI